MKERENYIILSMLETENKLETILQRVGSKGKYQILLFAIFAIKWFLAGMILFSLNFFYITPQFVCTEGYPGFDTCQKYVCSHQDPKFWLKHLQQPIPSSISLDFEVVLLCGNQWLGSLLQTITYFGSFCGFLIMSHISDNIGRKLAERISWAINIIGLVGLSLSMNLTMIGISSFIMGFGTNAAITLHYSFLKELVSGKMRSRMIIALQVAFSFGVFFIALLSMLIFNWKIIVGSFLITPSVLVFIGLDRFIVDTPTFSLKKGKIALLNDMNKISKINNCQALQLEDINDIISEEEKLIKNQQKALSILDLFRYPSLRLITIVCALVNMIIEFVYDGTILSLDKIGINVYLDQMLVGLVQISAAIFSSYIIVKVYRRKYTIISLIITCISTTAIGVLSITQDHNNQSIDFHVILQMVALAFLRFFINSLWGVFFVFVAQLYPSCVTSLSFGWISATGTIGACVSPFIRLATAQFTMFFMAILSLLGALLVRLLKQTKDEAIKLNIVEKQASGKASTISSQQNK